MTANTPLRQFRVDRLVVEVHASNAVLGRAAAARSAQCIQQAIRERDQARIIVATGNSQKEVIASLVDIPDLEWSKVEVFHMDEYVGISEEHPASFRLWLKTRIEDVVRPKVFHPLAGDARDVEQECRRYEALLRTAPIDVCLLGFGENGHIAFNDPHEADFEDPLFVRQVLLDERCRQQQVGEGHFPSLRLVPTQALTLTVPALMAAGHLVCSVPERRKAEAVRDALKGPISPSCPASIVRTHPDAVLYLDRESAALTGGE